MEIIEPQNLQEHVQDEKTGKYTCDKCNYKGFSNFVKLVQHIARHHGNDGIYRCGLCQELEQMNQLVLDMFVVFAMLCLMFPEI
jgi:predicted SprT family Zn-dependent metalloprotease